MCSNVPSNAKELTQASVWHPFSVQHKFRNAAFHYKDHETVLSLWLEFLYWSDDIFVLRFVFSLKFHDIYRKHSLAETRFFFSNVPMFHQSNFKVTHVKKNGSNLGFGGILRRTLEKNGLKFGIRAYPDHFQNWLDFVTLLWFFQILSLWNRTDLGFPGVFVERMEGVAWSLTCCCIPANYRTD